MQAIGSFLPRIALFISGTILSAAGVVGLFNPDILTNGVALEPAGTTGVRVDFGGFHLGLGLFALAGVFFKPLLKPGLIAMALTTTLVIVSRLIGINLDGMTDQQMATLSRELIPWVLSIVGLIVAWRYSDRP